MRTVKTVLGCMLWGTIWFLGLMLYLIGLEKEPPELMDIQ